MIELGGEAGRWSDSEVMRELCSVDYSFLGTIHFALLFSAFIPRDPILRDTLYLSRRWVIGRGGGSGSGGVRVMHVMGEQDRVIAIEASRELVGCFDESAVEVVVHSGGHHVPSGKPDRLRYGEFIQQQVERGVGAGNDGKQNGVSAGAREEEKKAEGGKEADDEPSG